VFDIINKDNNNMCEENGGVVYCYHCAMETLEQDYPPLILTLNIGTNIKLPPRYYLEYDTRRQRCLLLMKGIGG